MILYEGGRNVLGSGMASWDIAAFSTYLACFLKLAVKSSHAAKLFNAVQKAQVSWQRIRPQLQESAPLPEPQQPLPADVLTVQGLAFTYPDTEKPVFHGLSFTARPNEIIGIPGPVACGKSTLGRALLCESPHDGTIYFGSQELGNGHGSPVGIIGYSGHSPELFSGTIAENIQFGCTDRPDDFRAVWQAICLDADDLPDGPATRIGPGGLRLSGGQQARVALARALFSSCPVLVLDDPFASVDQKTEARILQHLRQDANGRIILLISHRLTVFPQLDQVIWMQPGGAVRVADHTALYEQCGAYRRLYDLQVPQSPAESLPPLASLGNPMRDVWLAILRRYALLFVALLLVIAADIAVNVTPPLVLQYLVDHLADGTIAEETLLLAALLYFALCAAGGLVDTLKETGITVLGQKITHGLRSAMCQRLSRLPADFFVQHEAGALSSRFINDVDTLESLFDSSVVSMVADTCTILAILAVVSQISGGLGILLVIALPLLFLLTRYFQQRMRQAQLDNRAAVAETSALIPETVDTSAPSISASRSATWQSTSVPLCSAVLLPWSAAISVTPSTRPSSSAAAQSSSAS